MLLPGGYKKNLQGAHKKPSRRPQKTCKALRHKKPAVQGKRGNYSLYSLPCLALPPDLFAKYINNYITDCPPQDCPPGGQSWGDSAASFSHCDPIVIAVFLPQAASSSHFVQKLLSVKPLNINLCISAQFAAIPSTKKWTILWQNIGASLWSNIFQDNIFKYFPRKYRSKGTLKLPTCVGAISSKPFNPRSLSLYKKKKNLNKTTVPYLKSCLESEVNLWRLCSA